MGVMMSKAEAAKLSRVLKGIDPSLPAMVRIAREPQRGLVVQLIKPPYGTAMDGRVETLLESGVEPIK